MYDLIICDTPNQIFFSLPNLQLLLRGGDIMCYSTECYDVMRPVAGRDVV